MTDREWADARHAELEQVLYVNMYFSKKSTYYKNCHSLGLKLFKLYKEKVQKLDYETGKPIVDN